MRDKPIFSGWFDLGGAQTPYRDAHQDPFPIPKGLTNPIKALLNGFRAGSMHCRSNAGSMIGGNLAVEAVRLATLRVPMQVLSLSHIENRGRRERRF